MKTTSSSDEMAAEYDFSNAVRGRYTKYYADLTPEQREELMRLPSAGDVWAWLAYAISRVQALEVGLFTYLHTSGDAPPPFTRNSRAEPEFAGLDELAKSLAAAPLLADKRLAGRVCKLVKERNWLVHRAAAEGEALGPQYAPVARRLRRIVREAEALKDVFDAKTADQFARDGVPQDEAERRMEEARRLWLAA